MALHIPSTSGYMIMFSGDRPPHRSTLMRRKVVSLYMCCILARLGMAVVTADR